jgi:hypothetical protein
MSVAPEWRVLPFWRIPKRLRPKCPGASGTNQLHCWKHGEGLFEEALVTEQLLLRPDKRTHGLVEPAHEMPLADYEAALEATRDGWVIDEG